MVSFNLKFLFAVKSEQLLVVLGHDGEVSHEREVIRSIGQVGNPLLANVLAGWKFEDGIDSESVRGVEDVVDGLDVFAIVSDFPGRVFGFLAGRISISRFKAEKIQ
jgi:hypothetical protein